MKRAAATSLVLAFLSVLPGSARAGDGKIDFAHDIAPLIKRHCAECHTNGKRKGGLSLDSREEILKKKAALPGKSGSSELIRRLTSTDADERMPAKKKALDQREIALFRAWIDQGLPWEPGFTFQGKAYIAPLKLRPPVLQAARSGHDHPIDRIVDAYWAEHHVEPPAPLDDEAFLRRLYLDVLGLLPTPAERLAFLHDTSANKRLRWIRQALGERRPYAEHWLSFWNDLLRNDYQGTGYIDGGRQQITAWLYRALLDNKPYDQFVRELISPTRDCEGFAKGIKWRGKVNASQVPELQFSQNVSQVFLGINMKCASCHDSFIDTWKLDDAYGLAAVIAEQPLEIYRCDKPTGVKATPHFLWSELGSIDATQSRNLRLEQLARLVTHRDNGRFSRTIVNRIWQRLFGRGLVHPVDIMANPPWSLDLLDHLADYLGSHGYDCRQLLEYIVSSRAYQSQTVVIREELPNDDYVFHGPQLRRMTVEQYLDAIWMITGTAPTKIVAPITPPAYAPSTPPERQFIRTALVNADALMRALGRPNREQVVTTRPDELTTLEALDLSNGQILTDTLARGATNLLKTAPGASPDSLIEEIYLRALCRRPGSAELVTARTILGPTTTPETLADLLWTVFMLPEFQLIR
jgi:hypothetical protein